jgi:hypothetical protein
MGLFDRSGSKLSGKTTLLLAADPGNALMDAARLYDPDVRSWPGRLIFRNGVLLFGPVPVTPKLEQQAGLPAGMAVAYYVVLAMQSHRDRRPDDSKQRDGDKLVQGLAQRLGGIVKYAEPPLDLAVLPRVYGEQAVPPEQVIEVLRPYGGDFKVENQTEYSYSLSGKKTYFYVAYWSSRLYQEKTRRRPSAHCAPGRCITGTCTRAAAGRTSRANWRFGSERRRSHSPAAAAALPLTSTDSPQQSPGPAATLRTEPASRRPARSAPVRSG